MRNSSGCYRITSTAALLLASGCAADGAPAGASGALAPNQGSNQGAPWEDLPERDPLVGEAEGEAGRLPSHDSEPETHAPEPDVREQKTGPLLEMVGLAPELRRLIERLLGLYAPEAERHGRELQLLVASGKSGGAIVKATDTHWRVHVSRVLLEENPGYDIMGAVLCHELGHLFSGFPFNRGAPGQLSSEGTFESMEGQADYFAGKDCLPRLFANEPELNATFRAEVDAVARKECDRVWRSKADRDICYRVADTAERFVMRMANDGKRTVVVDLSTPTRNEVSATLTSHPPAQCRLDTVFQGALCTTRIPSAVIPGMRDGRMAVNPEQVASPYACGAGVGARPRCWFKPNEPSFDCTDVPNAGLCHEQAGQLGFTSCDRTEGPVFRPCAEDELCTVEFGAAACFRAEDLDALREPL